MDRVKLMNLNMENIILSSSIIIVLIVTSCADSSSSESPKTSKGQFSRNTDPPISDPEPLVHSAENDNLPEEYVNVRYHVINASEDNCETFPCERPTIKACDIVSNSHSVAIIKILSKKQEQLYCDSPFKSPTTEFNVQTMAVLGGSPVPEEFELQILALFGNIEVDGILFLVPLRRTETHWLTPFPIPITFENGTDPVISSPWPISADLKLEEKLNDLKREIQISMNGSCRLDNFSSDEDYREMYYKEKESCIDEEADYGRPSR